MAHATLSPSSAHRWMACTGSVAACAGLDRGESSEHADEGTAAHTLASWCLDQGKDTAAFLGVVIEVGERSFAVTQDMAEAVQAYVTAVRAEVGDGELYVEQEVPLEHMTYEAGAVGTADAIVVREVDGRTVLQVHDLKYGRGVPVSAVGNRQLRMYASGARQMVGMFGHEPDLVAMYIHQPRLDSVSSETIPADALDAFEAEARAKALLATAPDAGEHRTPGESQCRWCLAKPTCPAVRRMVEETLGADFDDLDTAPVQQAVERTLVEGDAGVVAKLMAIEEFVLDLFKKARARGEAMLLAGQQVPGFKLVQGRRGARAWSDAEAAEAMLKSFRLKHDQIYDYKVISPTQAERLAKAEAIGQRQWPKLQSLITQHDGKPSVVPSTDPRPALDVAPKADDFEVLGDELAS